MPQTYIPERPHERAATWLYLWMATVLLLTTAGLRADSPPQVSDDVITDLPQIWSVPSTDMHRLHPLHAEAEILFYDPGWHLLWVRSGGASTWVDNGLKPLAMKSGQRVRFDGEMVPAEGLDASRVRVTVLGEAASPPAPLVSLRDDPSAAEHHVQRVTLQGFVNSQTEADATHLYLELIVNGRLVDTRVLIDGNEPVPQLQQATVRVTGLLVLRNDPAGRMVGMDVWVSKPGDIQVMHWMADDPAFQLPPTPADLWPTLPAGQVVRLVGTVRSKPAADGFLVRDETGQIEVRTAQQLPVKLGDTIEAVGYPVSQGTERLLTEAVFRRAAEGTAPAKAAKSQGLPKLRLTQQVLELASSEAARGYPVRVSGVVLWSSPVANHFFVADASGGVRVERNPGTSPPPVGTSLRLSGTTGDGQFSPVILASQWDVLGTLNLPAPRRVTLEQAMTGVEEAQWIELHGVVREVVRDAAWTRLQLSTSAGEFSALVSGAPEASAPFRGAIVWVRGVCSAVSNDHRQLVGVELHVPTLDYVQVEDARPSDLFTVPARSIASLREYSPLQSLNRRVRLSGIVLYHARGKYLFIQDDDDGLLVLSRSDTPLQPGDRVEVVGLPGREGSRAVLREAAYRKVGSGSEPAPAPLAFGGRSFNGEMDGRLVRVAATVLDSTVRRGARSFVLQAGDVLFEARVDVPAEDALAHVLVGSRISAVGVYRTESDEYRNVTGFNLQLRGPADIRVIEAPSWWTVGHALTVAGLSILTLFGGLVWVGALRRRVRQQTDQIRTQLEKENDLEARYRDIVENASDFIFTLDNAGAFTSFNPAGERILGYTREAALAMNIHDLLAPEDRRSLLPFIESPGQKGATVTTQSRFRRRDGQIIWLEISARRAGDHGDSGFILAVGRDVTERKQIEEELKRARDAAEANTRAKSSFLANMSHEIRTPMNGVIGMSNLLLDTPLNRTQREFAETIRTSADALLTVLNDILDFSKMEAGKLTFETLDFNLRETIDETIELLAPRAAGKGLELAAFVPADLPCFLRGDPGRIRQVLMNLLGNAIKFTDRGEVVLHVSHERKSERDVRLRFEVTDTGIGIPPEEQARLFAPFAQADSSTTRRFGGTGLGLAICRQIVQLMRGEIGVRSRTGLGSTFWFTAEMDRQPDQPSRAPLGPAESLAGRRVLVVDDNETNRRIMEHYLAAWNLQSVQVASGPEALKALRDARADGRPFDLAALDFEMPQMDGAMLAHAIHEDPALTGLPIVLCTSWDKVFDRPELKKIGIVHVMLKPVRQPELLTALLEADAARRAAQPEPPPPPPVKTTAGSRPPIQAASPARILVAEDNAVNQRVTLLQLQKLGYRADVAWTGVDVLESLERSGYDIVLMDCQMPEMDGYEASRRIRQNPKHRRVKIVAMTANAMVGDRERCIAAGMDDYISKPTRLTDLQDVLRRTLKD